MIQVSAFGSVLTVVFLNKSHNPPTPTVWVCADREAFDAAKAKLAAMSHIEVIQAGPSHVEQ